MLSLIRDSIDSLLFPRRCASCRLNQIVATDGLSCSNCWNQTQIFDGTEALCRKCGIVLGLRSANETIGCWQCDGHDYDTARACGIYSFALAAAVIELKTTPVLSYRVRRILSEATASIAYNSYDLVVPVPLSKRRRLERGHNQAEVMGELVSKVLGVPMDGNSLQRTTHSPMHRLGMDKKARELSVKNAFGIVRPKLIHAKRILLVDDVYTTGATVSHCAKALKKHGAVGVDVLTIARAAPLNQVSE